MANKQRSLIPIIEGGTNRNTVGSAEESIVSDGSAYIYSANSYIGQLKFFANQGSAYVSSQWLECDGATYAQATYPTLYDRYGTVGSPGAGDFIVPTTSTEPQVLALASQQNNFTLYLRDE